jgi:hypothetical protein
VRFKHRKKQSHSIPMEEQRGEEVYLLLILDLGTTWGWVGSVTPQPRFPPWERTPGTHWTGGWVGPRAGLDTEVRGKILCLCRGSNLNRADVQCVARQYTDWATPAPRFNTLYLASNSQSEPGLLHRIEFVFLVLNSEKFEVTEFY